jgi:hypothetical protein
MYGNKHIHRISIPKVDQSHYFFHKHSMAHHQDLAQILSLTLPLQLELFFCHFLSNEMLRDNMDID